MRVGGNAVALERKSLEVLLQLLYRAGEVVTKEELLEAVWPGRIVSESVPAKCVSRIREVLGDDEQNIIKTVHGYGYRLTNAVTVEQTRTAPSITRLDLEPGGRPPLRPLWSLVRRLGSGGQGEVWLGEHEKTRERRVYKFALDAHGLAAIKREITLSRVLRDTLGARDDFALVLDWNLEEAPYFIELDYAEHGNLESWLSPGGPGAGASLPERLELVARVAEALAAAHSVGVLHKDLKPSNVLINGDAAGPRITLTDFGSGGIVDPARLEGLGITRLGFTRSVLGAGAVAGTALYLPPEVITGQPATVQGDIYALGIMLYQAIIGDFKQPLAAGWEERVDDPLLREDVALAVAGDPRRRLADALQLSDRLRTLEARRDQRRRDQEARLRLEHEQVAAVARARQAELALTKIRARRNGMLTAVAALVVGLALSLALYIEARRARHEADRAAASSQAVADFLSNDLFSAVGERPLRDLTVQDLLESASINLAKRGKDVPEVAAQLHAALGRAFIAVENVALAEQQLDRALTDFEGSHHAGSEGAMTTAAQLLMLVAGRRLWELPAALPRYENLLAQGLSTLGPRNPSVLDLREQLATARFWGGDWRRGADELRQLIQEQRAVPERAMAMAVGQARLAEMLVQRGEFVAAVAASAEAVSRLSTDPAAPPLTVALVRLLHARALIERELFADAEVELARAEALSQAWSVGDGSSTYPLTIALFRGLRRLRQGEYADAIALLEPALASLTALDWIKANDTLAEFRSWLAEAYRGNGRHVDARRTMQRALDVAESQWAKGTPLVQGMRIGLADIVRERDRAAARQILAAVDRRVLTDLGEDHPYVAMLNRVEGLLALAEARPDPARQALNKALRIFEARYGPEHAFTRRARRELAQVET